MQMRWAGIGAAAILVLGAAAAFSQQADQGNPGNASKSVKAESVTINMPEGMTREQADAILNELKQIHQLLQNQQTAAAGAKAAPAPRAGRHRHSDKVQMSVGKGWYSMGREDAPVTMVEFTDYQCPFCRRFRDRQLCPIERSSTSIRAKFAL